MLGRKIVSSLLSTSLCCLTASTASAADTKWSRQGDKVSGNVVVRTATDLTKLKGVRVIEGDLDIQSIDSVDLKPLAGLTSIKGKLVVSYTKVESLHGLESLGCVEGAVLVMRNQKLKSVAALKNLKTVYGNLTILDNPLLSSLPAAGIRIGEPVKKTVGSLIITGNRALSSAEVKKFAERCTINGRVTTRDNG